MSNAIDVLREQYNIMISQEEDWSFFRALAGYINYILETPILKKIIDGVMEKKQKEYDKLAELEEKALEELETSKDKLLKIIKDNNISPNSLSADFSIIPQGGNVLENLKEFEKNKLWISGFRSDNLERFLFDIASSILKSNHKSLLKNFLVSDEEYRKYHYEPDSKFTITGNENGNFVFSKSLKLRREQSRFIEKTEKFQLWGAFNALLKFQEAFLEKSKNKDFGYISKGHKKGARNWQEGDDTVDIVFFAQDLEEIAGLKNGKPHPNSRHHLKKDSFKNYTSIVNAYLIKELAKDGSREEVRTDVFTEKVKKTEDLLNKLEKDINKRIGAKEPSETDKLIDELEKDIYKKVRKNEEAKKDGENDSKASKQIKKITIIKMNNGKKLVAINGDLTETREIKDYSVWWQIFTREIEERNMRPETRNNVKEIPKSMVSYFNYNAKKCLIYMGGKYTLSNVFVGRGIDTMINPDIKTNVMTERQYLARKNRKK